MAADPRVVPATKADIDRIVEIQFEAFEGDPYQEALFPGDQKSEDVRRRASERTLQYFNSDPTARWLICKDKNSDTPVGFAIWNVYDHERPESEWRKEPEVDWCTGRKKEIAFNFLSTNTRLRQRIWAGKPYVLLNLLCIDPKSQRQGAGTLLVEWGTALAESLGLSAYLEASPAGYHLYRKLGFRQVDVGVVKADEWDGDHDRKLIAMVKDPSKGS